MNKYVHKLRYYALYFYVHSKLYVVMKFLKFAFHRYDTSLFNPLLMKENLMVISSLKQGEGLDATLEGKLRKLETKSQRAGFKFKNGVFLGAYQKRVQRVIFYSFLSSCLEINNPFDLKILKMFMVRKMNFIKKLLKKVDKINGRKWDVKSILENLDLYERGSLVQASIIKSMNRATRKKDPPIILEVKKGMKKGYHPLLIVQGCSGAYWMRGPDREILGLFKPYDEELYAPNNPVGPVYRAALGSRRARRSIRSGEGSHREVAAYVVDQFFGFGMVPKTYYATFSHHVFCDARHAQHTMTPFIMHKKGSFQEYIDGFVTLHDFPKDRWVEIPDEEFQLLILLDLIIGNTDRNTGNVLIGENKIAAIDHGLIFPDVNRDLTYWYWERFEQGKHPLHPVFIELLKTFPYEKLAQKLAKKCFISLSSLDRMRERVALFKEGALLGLAPFQLKELFSNENLFLLRHLNQTLDEKARELALAFLKDKNSNEN